MRAKPVIIVKTGRRTTAVGMASCGVSDVSCDMVEDMEERKRRPASWTWPIEKGMVEKRVRVSWWMAEERIISFDREGRNGA